MLYTIDSSFILIGYTNIDQTIPHISDSFIRTVINNIYLIILFICFLAYVIENVYPLRACKINRQVKKEKY